MIRTSTRVLSALAIGASLLCASASAQIALPEGPVRIVVPTTPGTTPDIMARAMAPKLSERLQRPVVVENKVGAGGNIGTDMVVRSTPNGSTLLLSASSLTVGATLYPQLPYDPARDLTPISLVGWNRLVLVTSPQTGFKTVKDLVDAAKKTPGRINYGSPGVGTPNHLVAELLKAKTGTFMTHIPYPGSAPQTTALIAGQIDMAPLTANVAAPHVRSGRMVALAITGDKRSELLPGVPALADVGIPGVSGDIWYGFLGPKGMSPELAAHLNREINAVMVSEDVAAGFKKQGFDIEPGTPEAFRKLIVEDVARWGALIKAQGISAN